MPAGFVSYLGTEYKQCNTCWGDLTYTYSLCAPQWSASRIDSTVRSIRISVSLQLETEAYWFVDNANLWLWLAPFWFTTHVHTHPCNPISTLKQQRTNFRHVWCCQQQIYNRNMWYLATHCMSEIKTILHVLLQKLRIIFQEAPHNVVLNTPMSTVASVRVARQKNQSKVFEQPKGRLKQSLKEEEQRSQIRFVWNWSVSYLCGEETMKPVWHFVSL